MGWHTVARHTPCAATRSLRLSKGRHFFCIPFPSTGSGSGFFLLQKNTSPTKNLHPSRHPELDSGSVKVQPRLLQPLKRECKVTTVTSSQRNAACRSAVPEALEGPVAICKQAPYDWLRERIVCGGKKKHLPNEEPPSKPSSRTCFGICKTYSHNLYRP